MSNHTMLTKRNVYSELVTSVKYLVILGQCVNKGLSSDSLQHLGVFRDGCCFKGVAAAPCARCNVMY